MKQIKESSNSIVLFIAATVFVNAQSKVAHINVTELLAEMPEMKAAQAELKKLQETYKADIESSMTELKNKYTQYSSEAPPNLKKKTKKELRNSRV